MTPVRSEHGAWPCGGENMESMGKMNAVDCQLKLPRDGLRARGSGEPNGRARCGFDLRAVVTPTCHPPPIEGGTAVRFGPLPTIRQLGEERGCVPSSPRRHRWSRQRSEDPEIVSRHPGAWPLAGRKIIWETSPTRLPHGSCVATSHLPPVPVRFPLNGVCGRLTEFRYPMLFE